MRSWIDARFLACAACIAAATACSDDETPSTHTSPLLPDSGVGGSSGAAGAAGAAGTAGRAGSGGSAGGSTAGSGGRPASGGAPSGADAGVIDAGSGGAADGGVEPGEADTGVPDAGGGETEEPPPADDVVTFAELFPVLQANCGSCHGGGGLPAFAQANQDAAYAVTQGTSDDGDLFYEEMVERAVVARTMPPACNGQALGTGACLSVADADLLQAWVDDGAPR
jgi:hypothetical protein